MIDYNQRKMGENIAPASHKVPHRTSAMDSSPTTDMDLFFEHSGDMCCVLEARDWSLTTTKDEAGVDFEALVFEKVNLAFATILGWSKHDIVGTRFIDLLHPHDLPTYPGSNKINTSEKAPNSIDLISCDRQQRFHCRDGTYRWIWWKISKLVPSSLTSNQKLCAIGRDITEQKEAEDKLRASERRLKESQLISKLGQWDFDLINDNLQWSAGIYDLFKVDPQEFGGSYQAFLDAIHPDDREKVNSAYMAHLDTKESYEIIHRLLLPDKTVKWVLESCRSEYDVDGTPVRSIGTVQDITELKQAQEDSRMDKERAEQADRLKSAFLANMSHEIRTPLNAVIGFTDLMLMDSNIIPNDHREYLETINKSGSLLLALINDILDISLIEAGGLHTDHMCFSLSDILKTTEANVRGLVCRKGHAIEFKSPPATISGVQDAIMGDPARLQQVLNNLLRNAFKFCHQGKVEYTVKLVACSAGPMLEFMVKDEGVGIPAIELCDIFEPFHQAHCNKSSGTCLGGAGLGLAIASKLVEKMGGEISVESCAVGNRRGSTFRFTIPYIPADSPMEGVNSSVTECTFEQLKGKILLVDDNVINRKLAGRFLTKMGCSYETAENGQSALAKYRLNPTYDIILMDKEMPIMDGLKAVQAVRSIEANTANGGHIPIIAVTAATTAGDREQCLDAGCDDYITKPLNRMELHAKLAKYIKHQYRYTKF